MARKKIRTYAPKEKESSTRRSNNSNVFGKKYYAYKSAEDIIAQYRDQPLDVAYEAFAKYHAEREKAAQETNEISKENIPPNLKAKLKSTEHQGKEFTAKDRKHFEAVFGESFSGVKIHTGPTAEQLTKMLGARAFAFKNNIYFGKNEYSPNTQEGKKLIAHELTHTIQQRNSGQEKIQRWVLPTDWLDMVGLSIDLAERIYIELAYEEGQEKDFQRFVNSIFFALDAIMMALPGAGGAGLAFRGSHQLAVAGWAALPSSAKLTVTKEVAKTMGWGINRTAQMINRYFSATNNDKDTSHKPEKKRHNIDSHEEAGGHTGERHIGKSEEWLKNRLKEEPNIPMASSFYSKEHANWAQNMVVRKHRKEIDAWLKSGQTKPLIIDIAMQSIIGKVLKRGKNKAVPTKKVRAIVVKNPDLNSWHFKTSFPTK